VPLPLLTILIDEQECKYIKDTTRIYVTHHCGILHVFTFLLTFILHTLHTLYLHCNAIGIFVFNVLYTVNQSQQTELSGQSEQSSLWKRGI